MPCPLYKQGVCTSPKLGAPADIYKPGVCDGSEQAYTKCSLYPSGSQLLEGLLKSASLPSGSIVPYVHYLVKRPESSCPHFKVFEHGGSFVAYCAVLARYLTKYEVEPCEKLPEKCPLRAFA